MDYKKEVDPNDDVIYYNIMISNNINSTIDELPAISNDSRTQPIIDKPSEYYLTVTRFSLLGYNIPIMEFPIKAGISQNNPNLSIFTVSTEYNGMVNTQPVIFKSYVQHATAPVPPSLNPPSYTAPDSPYYYVYEYHHMLDMINNAMATSVSGLTGATGTPPPFFTYDDNQLISLVAPQQYYDLGGYGATGGTGTIKVYCNYYLFNYLQSIPVYAWGKTLDNDRNYQFLLNDNHNNIFGPTTYSPNLAGNTGFIKLTMEFNTLNNWSTLSSIVILSNSLPIRKEYVPINNINNNNQTSSQNNFRSILTDFIPLLEKNGDNRSHFVYYPSAQYRLINMLGDNPIYNIDIGIYWQDRNNNLHPIIINRGQSASVKLAFLKKSTYKNK